MSKQPELSPWDSLPESGDGLTVDLFLTTLASQLATGLRRSVTLPYARAAGLTVPQWRLLALVAHARQLGFAELVAQSTSDKALVSRTVRQLEQRGLVNLSPEAGRSRGRLVVAVTAAGIELHAQVIPVARQRQAQMIRQLTVAERRGLYAGMLKLIEACRLEGAGEAPPDEDGEAASPP